MPHSNKKNNDKPKATNGTDFSPKNNVLGLCKLLDKLSCIDDKKFRQLVSTLSNAIAEGHQICFDGEGRSLNVAQAFASLILGIGGQAYFGKQPPVYRQGARYVVISGSGRTTGPLKRLQLAKKAGLETILITADASSTTSTMKKNLLAGFADLVVEVITKNPQKMEHDQVLPHRPRSARNRIGGWLEKQLEGTTVRELAPMGTVFEEAAFVTSILAAINIADTVRGITAPKLRFILDQKDFKRQFSKLLELVVKGGIVNGTRITGLCKEADSLGARELVRLLCKGGDVMVSGEGVTNCIMEMFAQRLYHLKFRAHTTSGTIVPPITPDMMLVCASMSGQSNSPLVSASIAARKKSRLAVITGDLESHLARIAKEAGAPITLLSDLDYATREGFAEKRFTRKMTDPIHGDIVDPIFATKCLLLCDGVVAKLMELMSITESRMKTRHQLDKEKI